MNFSQALEELKKGKKIAREHWEGYWQIKTVINHDDEGKIFKDDMIIAFLAGGNHIAPASPYQGDILAEDWKVVE